MSRQVVDPLQRLAGFAGVERGPDLVDREVGQAQAGRRQRVGGGAQAFGGVEVLDRAGGVVGRAASSGPGDQVEPQPASKLDRLVMVGHLGPAGQCVRFLEPTAPRGFLGLPQDDPPLTQHG